MKANRTTVRNTVYVLGPLVLISYAAGLARISNKDLLWGGIPESLRMLNVSCMFIAALGFLVMWWLFLYKWEEQLVERLDWPWNNTEKGGHRRLLLAYLLILIPSSLWLELTIFHIHHAYNWSPFIVIADLTLVAIGNILLGMLAWDAHRKKIGKYTKVCLLGVGMFAIQVIINDAIWWSIRFPW